jgi:hypothetical protein
VFEQAVDFFGSRRAHLHRLNARRGRVRRRVRPNPLPTHRLGQSPMKDAVHPPHRPGRQRFAVQAAIHSQRCIELIDHDGSQLAHQHVPESRAELAIYDRARALHGRPCPVRLVDGKPALEEFPCSRASPHNRGCPAPRTRPVPAARGCGYREPYGSAIAAGRSRDRCRRRPVIPTSCGHAGEWTLSHV